MKLSVSDRRIRLLSVNQQQRHGYITRITVYGVNSGRKISFQMNQLSVNVAWIWRVLVGYDRAVRRHSNWDVETETVMQTYNKKRAWNAEFMTVRKLMLASDRQQLKQPELMLICSCFLSSKWWQEVQTSLLLLPAAKISKRADRLPELVFFFFISVQELLLFTAVYKPSSAGKFCWMYT